MVSPKVDEGLYLPDLLGGITIEARNGVLKAVHFGWRATGKGGPFAQDVAKQLREYLNGKRRIFEAPLDLRGTPFQLSVWRALMDIPYGSTASYRDIAVAIGCPKGFQAVGQANHHNPIPIIVPCHRVIAANGAIGGYGGGLERKKLLLDLERGDGNLFESVTGP